MSLGIRARKIQVWEGKEGLSKLLFSRALKGGRRGEEVCENEGIATGMQNGKT